MCIALHRVWAVLWVVVWTADPAVAAGGNGDSLPGPATQLEKLIDRFRAMPGFSARFEEEKIITLLERPLRSRGVLHFVPPQLLLRRVEQPTPSLLRLDGDQLSFTDATGSETFDLGANPTARAFAHTFTDILAGDIVRLRSGYEIDFVPERVGPKNAETAWRIDLTPRDPALARAITRLTLRGHGLVLIDLVVREAGGDATLTHFEDVNASRRFEEAEIAQLLRPPTP
jgi:hypothetical protein